MKVEVIPVGSYQRKLEFWYPASTVKAELDRAYRDVSGRARLSGFRKGKIPRKVLEARFGPQIHSDVATQLIQQGWSQAIDEHKLEPVGRPQVQDRAEIVPDSDFRFTITVDVKPTIELAAYTGLEVAYPPVEVTDEELDGYVKARLEGQAKLTEVTDRPVQKGDMVIVELVAKAGEEELSREPGTMIRTSGDPYYPGVDDLLVGMALNEEKTGKVAFPATARIEGVQGREADVTVKVVSIQANEVPELTDALASEMGFEGGSEGMRTALRLQLQTARETNARNQARANLLQALINANPFEVPTPMIDQHLQMLIDELKLQQAYRGRDPKRITFSPEQIADLRIRAEFAAKGGLILDWVSKTEKLDVAETDLEAKYQELADERGQTVEAIRGYFVKDDAVEELRARLLEEKTLDFLLERAKIVSAESPAAPAAAAEPAAEEAKPAKKAKAKKAEAEAAPAEGEAAPAEEAAPKAKKSRAKAEPSAE
jgi:trigger factor